MDLQCSAVTRPTFDLANLIWQNTTPDLRKNHLQSLMNIYHKSLMEELNLLGLEVRYNLETFLADFNECFVHGFMMGLINLQARFLIFLEHIDPSS